MKKWGLVGVYLALMLWTIRWGIPNSDHPYAYQMDEWHSLMAVKALFTHGTTAVDGAAHGTVLYFFQAGIFLIPFWLLGIINPLAIKSGLTELVMQEKIFMLLRLNTIVFGIGSILLLHKILKEQFQNNSAVPLILFIFTPIWLTLGNYFKYDIALVFWILLFLYFLLKNSYYLAGIIAGLAVAFKISALPLLLAYFIFGKSLISRIKGMGLALAVILIAGAPDIFWRGRGYWQLITATLNSVPSLTNNLILPLNYWLWLLVQQFPLVFGWWLTIMLMAALIYFTFKHRRRELILLTVFGVLALSLIPLKIYAAGSRALVLLPLMVLIVGRFIQKVKLSRWLLLVGVGLQIGQALSYYSVKLFPDPRQTASTWIKANLPAKQTIGIENVPIYQLLPDVLLTDFYSVQRTQIVNASTPGLPEVIVITNGNLETNFLKQSPKKDLLARLNRDNYYLVKEFEPELKFYRWFGRDLNFFAANLVPAPLTIEIYSL